MNKLLLVCLLVFAPFSLASADLKIAVIDLSKAFDQYYKTKDAQKLLKEKQDGYQKEIQDQINDYQRMGRDAEALDKAAKDPTLAPAARDEKSQGLGLEEAGHAHLRTRFRK